jgi:hypothetical protein
MEKEMFEVDPRIWSLDDPRIINLESRKITQTQFMHLIRPEDPFEMRSGKLVFLSEDDMQKRSEEYVSHMKTNMRMTGGLNGTLVYDNRDKFLQVFPEIKPDMDAAQAIIDKENCKGCAKNRHTLAILQALEKLPKQDRDLSPIQPLIAKMPFAEKWLRGLPFEVEDKDIPVPAYFKNKVKIPARSTQPYIAPLNLNRTLDEYTQNRKQCINCAKKHVAQALVLLREAEKGYPDHVELAFQHLKKAEPDVPWDKKYSFDKLMGILKKELDVLNLSTIHQIAEARKMVEEYLKDPSDPAALRLWTAIGHLAEAEDEAVNDYPELTAGIRKERIALMEDLKYSPALEFLLRKAVLTAEKK